MVLGVHAQPLAILLENPTLARTAAPTTAAVPYAASPRTRMFVAPAAFAVFIASVTMLPAPRPDPARPARNRIPEIVAPPPGMTQSAVARFEAGGTIPSLPVLDRLAHALDAKLTETQAQPNRSDLVARGGPDGRPPDGRPRDDELPLV